MKISVALLATTLGLATAWPTQIPFGGQDASTAEVEHEVEHARKPLWEELQDVPMPRWKQGRPAFPGRPMPPKEIDLSDYTIAQILNESLHAPHHDPHQGPPKWPPLKKFAFFVNISNESPFKESIADEKASITLIAPDDFALTPPRHRGPHHEDPHHGHENRPSPPPAPHHPGHHEHNEEMSSARRHPMHSPRMLSSLVEGSDEDEERKEKIKKIITLILRYHLVDSGAYTGHDLVNNATIASSLGERIRVSPQLFPYPSLVFNFFSRTRGPTIKAKNGYIHFVNEPLFPPLTPLEELFLFPFVFSELTSGLQKVDLDSTLSPWVHHQDLDEVAPEVSDIMSELVKEHSSIREFTVFAPSNRAFLKLGPKINAFLFSPFGRHILKAILSYHIVPDVAFFSDFISDPSKVSFTESRVQELPEVKEESMSEFVEAGLLPSEGLFERGIKLLPGAGEIKVKHYYLTTLFNDTKVPVDVYESRRGPFGKGPVKRDVWVGQESETPGSRVHVAVTDGVAYKGAVHVIGSLIRPPFPHGPHHHEGDHEHEHVKSEKRHVNSEERHFWRFARSLSGKKHGCPGKRANIWDRLLKF